MISVLDDPAIKNILSLCGNGNVISLAGGLPDENLFPKSLILDSLEKIARKLDILQYGKAQGYEPLLDFLRERYGLTSEQGLMTTTGAQQALDLIARTILNHSDIVVMEAPSYLGAVQIFEFNNANILTVSQLEDGPNVTELEEVFKIYSPKIFYGIPDFHNPTGICWTIDVRKKVAGLCEKYGVIFVEDTPYRNIRFYGEHLPMVSKFCKDHSLVVNSFSKLVSPGLRVGTIYGKMEIIDHILLVKQMTDLHSSLPSQAMLLEILSSEKFPDYLETLLDKYRNKYEFFYNNIQASLPSICSFSSIEGGMFLWIKFPQHIDVDVLVNNLLLEGVAVVPGHSFFSRRDLEKCASKNSIRVNFTRASSSEVESACEVIKRCIDLLVS